MLRTLFLIVIGLGLTIPELAAAVDRPPPPKLIKLKIRPLVGLGRSQAPQTFEVSLICDADKFYEGRLELKWYLGKGLVHEFLSQEMAVNAGGQGFRLTLPPVVLYSDKTNVTVYGRFLTDRGAIDLGEVPTDLPAMTRRTVVVADVKPQELLRAHYERGIPDAVGLEQFNPNADAAFDLLTYSARLSPEEMPPQAAGYAGFDVVVLEGEGFRRMQRGQLTAIADWVAGGGSALVAPPAANLTAAHVDFLNRLGSESFTAGGEAGSPPASFVTDERGRLVAPAGPSAEGSKLTRRHFGLGRAAIVLRPLDPKADFATREWKETLIFLWKIRAAHHAAILRTGNWDIPPPVPRGGWAPSVFAWQRDDLARSIRQLLIPERIEGVPFSVVAVILTLFLLAVAPGDYFLLGRLNCRKYTWWLFVLISAAFTLCTVKIAEIYMGHNDYQTALVFVDLEGRRGDANRTMTGARTSRFEMAFVSTQRTVEKALRNCLYVDITGSADIQDIRQLAERPFGLSEADELDQNALFESDRPVYEGVMPGAFTVHQQLRQWSPRITRETVFGANPLLMAKTTIDWNGLPTAALNSTEGRRALFAKVLDAEPAAQVLLLNGGWAYSPTFNQDAPGIIAAPATTLASSLTDMGNRARPPAAPFASLAGSALSSPAVKSALPAASLAVRASVRPATGIFSLFSQIAPTGGQIFEDLALLDDDDPQQWLLIVVVRRDNDWIVYRRLLYGASSPGRD